MKEELVWARRKPSREGEDLMLGWRKRSCLLRKIQGFQRVFRFQETSAPIVEALKFGLGNHMAGYC